MTTGKHLIRYISCSGCDEELGWKYASSLEWQSAVLRMLTCCKHRLRLTSEIKSTRRESSYSKSAALSKSCQWPEIASLNEPRQLHIPYHSSLSLITYHIVSWIKIVGIDTFFFPSLSLPGLLFFFYTLLTSKDVARGQSKWQEGTKGYFIIKSMHW